MNKTILCFILVATGGSKVNSFLCQKQYTPVPYFTNRFDGRSSHATLLQEKNFWDGIVSLWDEIIEVSTYGPSERKFLKAQREKKKQKVLDFKQDQSSSSVNAGTFEIDDDGAWKRAFVAAREKRQGSNSDRDDDGDEFSMEAFAAVKKKRNENTSELTYDGYALRDLLVSRWGVSLDVDFQRWGKTLYCTVLPFVGYGSPLKSRHDTELDYLMHLQGVVEILHQYDNLEEFIAFVETTDKTPKRGTDSVPFRLKLSSEDVEKIIAS